MYHSELHKLDLKDKSQDELLATKESLNSEISRAVAKENDIERALDSEIARAKHPHDSKSLLSRKDHTLKIPSFSPIKEISPLPSFENLISTPFVSSELLLTDKTVLILHLL